MNNDHVSHKLCQHCNDDEFDCECGENESEISVAKGLGFYVDDEGNWVPIDDNDITGFM